MSEITFTPGPWKFWAANNGGAGVKTADSKPVAICATGLGDNAAEMNARLIAAAPELLAALEEVHDYLVDGGESAGTRHLIEQAEAAIKKARGE